MPDELLNMLGPMIADGVKQMVIKDLKDPNSKISKTVKPWIDNITPDQLQTAIKDTNTPAPSDALHGIQDWEKFKPTTGEVVGLDIAMPVLGDLANATGKGVNLYNNLFAKVLQAMSAEAQRVAPKSDVSLAPAIQAAAAGKLVRGGIADIAGSTIANRMYQTADTLKNNNDRARMMALQTNEHPNVGFNNYMSKTALSGTRGSAGKQ